MQLLRGWREESFLFIVSNWEKTGRMGYSSLRNHYVYIDISLRPLFDKVNLFGLCFQVAVGIKMVGLARAPRVAVAGKLRWGNGRTR